MSSRTTRKPLSFAILGEAPSHLQEALQITVWVLLIQWIATSLLSPEHYGILGSCFELSLVEF